MEKVGQLIVKENGYIDDLRSPLIESGFSYINEKKKEISKSCLWVSTGFWNNNLEFVERDEVLDKKYSSLMRYVKRLAHYIEVEVKSQNSMYEGRKLLRKEYITPYLLEKIKSGEYVCI